MDNTRNRVFDVDFPVHLKFQIEQASLELTAETMSPTADLIYADEVTILSSVLHLCVASVSGEIIPDSRWTMPMLSM